MAGRRINRALQDARERKYRLRSRGGRLQGGRFIPDADSDFACMARKFANHVAEDAQRFGVAAEQSAKLTASVEAFREALFQATWSDRVGPKSTRIKNDARKELEAIVRAVARIVRGCETVTSTDRLYLNMHERPQRLKARECPQVAPVLKFIEATNQHKHVLEYGNDFDRGSSAKPHGASRMELFVGLVPPPQSAQAGVVGGGIPVHPEQLSGGLVWYVRSHSTSRFEVEYPTMADGRPMLVVYWGRWADARGGVGPFSATCVTRVEGGAGYLLPEVMHFPGAGQRALPRGVWAANRKIEATPVPAPMLPPASPVPAQLLEAGSGQRVVEVVAAKVRMLEAA